MCDGSVFQAHRDGFVIGSNSAVFNCCAWGKQGMFLKRHQTGIIQFNTKGWLKSLLYIETMAGEKKYWLFKTSVRQTVMKVEGHVGKKEGKRKAWLRCADSEWRFTRGHLKPSATQVETERSNIYYGLQSKQKMSCVCNYVTYCHIPFTLKQVKKLRTKYFILQTCTIFFDLFFCIFITVQAYYHIH